MKNLVNKRIPTILGIIIILIGIPLTTFIIKNQTIFKSNASNSQEPIDVKITNISDKSFTVTYQTNLPSTGSISYGSNNKLGESELDDIDKEKGSFSSKKIHSISVKKLTPSTKYYLTIISGSNTFLNGGSPFEVSTGPDISSPSAEQNIIKGKVVLPDGSAPSEALVYLNAENSQLLSSVLKDGKFSFSLKDLRTNDLSSYFNVSNDAIFSIVATDGSLKSTASVSLMNKDSVPMITLSNDYDFVQNASSVASESARSSSFPSIVPLKVNSKPEIINPKKDQSFTDRKPQFRGKSLPNETVEIIIHSSEELTAQVTADSNGNWIYKPSTELSPGNHTITIRTRDSSGILTTIAQSFTVLAAETSPTPTATPIPTQSVLPTLMPISTLMPSPYPTIAILVPSPILTPPIPILTSLSIESEGGLPPTGNSFTVPAVGGIITVIAGVVLFLLTHSML